ncbi:MAG: mevalonate kinase [archaeon]|jgi:mevalonate kinase|nr:mevalonate kinase [archaeon]
MGEGGGFGKTILFGEHFVVYGLPAIASALGNTTTAKVEKADVKGYELIDNRLESPGYKVAKKEEYEKLIENVINFMGVKEGIRITLGGKLVAASGVGASAACAASLARAINDEFQMDWDNDKINAAAYEGEKGPHGTPSGIDNTAAVFGGLIRFKKNLEGGPNTIEKMQIKAPVEIVLADSGKTSSTKEVVGDVRTLKEANPTEIDPVFEEYEKLAEEAKQALLDYDLQKFGELMNKNHELLQKITVSCEELDAMVLTAREAGAIGAKLTGTGRGGLMQALTPGVELQEKVAKALEEKGFTVIRTKIGGA